MLHQGFYEEPDVLKLDGLRTIALEIALAELLCTAPRPLALACADQALAGFDARLQATLRDEIAKRLQSRIDPRGTRRAEVLLGLASGLPESPAESAMLLALHDARLPMPVLQFRVLDLAGREVCHPRHPLRPLARIRLSHPRHPAPSAVNATLTAPTAASVAFTAFARRRHVA
jgi:hypothetical protein